MLACMLVCACWPAGPADVEVNDESSSSGVSASLCFDGTRNGDETDIDCGGTCGGCFGDARCSDNGDCASGFCDGGRCAYLRSCRELQSLADGADGIFWVDFDADGLDAPTKVLCDQSTDGGGWMLGFKVHRALRDGISERRNTLRDGFNPNLLLDVATTPDRGLASHGTTALSRAIDADAWARITLVAGADETQQETWFKRIASPRSLSRWFYDDDEPSKVCLAPSEAGPCDEGTVALVGATTVLGGVELRPHGYNADGAIQLSLAGSEVEPADIAPGIAGVCSMTKDHDDNAWKDTLGSEWGNGLLIWIR